MKQPIVKPHLDRALVKVLEAPKMTRGGIALPDTVTKEQVVKAQILATGPGLPTDEGGRIPMDVFTGQTVLLRQMAGAEFEHDGEKYMIVKSADILGVVA